MAIDLKAIAAKFAGTEADRQSNEREDAINQIHRHELSAVETDSYNRMMAARDAGDEELAQRIVAEFSHNRDELDRKYGFTPTSERLANA